VEEPGEETGTRIMVEEEVALVYAFGNLFQQVSHKVRYGKGAAVVYIVTMFQREQSATIVGKVATGERIAINARQMRLEEKVLEAEEQKSLPS